MKVVQQVAYTNPRDAVICADVDDLAEPQGEQVVLEMEAFPINPADVLTLTGSYAARPPLPTLLGAEGVGRVIAVGPDVSGIEVGDRVMPLDRDNWVQRKLVPASQAVKVDPDGDPLQLAMLKVNPATSYLMLNRYVDLQPGDYVVQNAANSAVGLGVIALAKRKGIRTINVVRRESLKSELESRGADLVVVEGEDLSERVRAAVGDAPVRLALDAVAGTSCLHLSQCLSDEGIVVNYGLLSGQPCAINASETVFRSISLQGFWLAKMLRNMGEPERTSLYAELTPLLADGTLSPPIEATYGIEQIKDAVEHAARAQRGGKILVTPNPS